MIEDAAFFATAELRCTRSQDGSGYSFAAGMLSAFDVNLPENQPVYQMLNGCSADSGVHNEGAD